MLNMVQFVKPAIFIAFAVIVMLGFTNMTLAGDDGYMGNMLKALSSHEQAPQAKNTRPDDALKQSKNIDSEPDLLPMPHGAASSGFAHIKREPITKLDIDGDDASVSGADNDKLAGSISVQSLQTIEPSSGNTDKGSKGIDTKKSGISASEDHGSLGTDQDYIINTGDKLNITVFGVEDLTGSYKVDRKGNITVPLVGDLHAAGNSKGTLEQLIAQKLIDGGYFNNPNVTVGIVEPAPFYILGEVKNPGSYDYVPGLDIFKAIAIAGGYTPRASKSKIIIIRDVDGEKVKIKATEETTVLPGDSIKVKQRFF